MSPEAWEYIQAVISFGISFVVLFTTLSICFFVFKWFCHGFKFGAARAALESAGGREMLASILTFAFCISIMVAIGTVDMSVLFD